jgi:vancomycin resistance protein YoaR
MENLDNKKVDTVQTELDFESPNKLASILNDINKLYPTIKEIIKDRVTYDGESYIINDVKMSEEELRSTMEKLNEYELNKSIKNEKIEEEEGGSYKYPWQEIHNR